MLHLIAQILGYSASLLLAISLMVNNNIRFRWINSSANLCFVTYGIVFQIWPVLITNAILLCINLYALRKIYLRQEKFDLVDFTNDSALVGKFLEFYAKDIHAYFPSFKLNEANSQLHFVVLRDLVIANIFVADMDAGGSASVRINYTVPKYRDYKVGRFLFEEGNHYLVQKGVKNIIYNHVDNEQHLDFLKKMGFREEGGKWEKKIGG